MVANRSHCTLPLRALLAGLLWFLAGDTGLPAESGNQKQGGPNAIAKYAPDELLVRFKPRVSKLATEASHARVRARSVRSFRLVEGLQVVKLPPGMKVEEAIRLYRQDPDVVYAEPNYIFRAYTIPNDPRFPEQWNLATPDPFGGFPRGGIDAVRAWDFTTGSDTAVVAVIDTGIDYRHPDLAANIFRNEADCDADNVDDDGNGYVDDCHGIDPLNHDSDPMDEAGHGTLVAGIIGAVGNNNLGVAGVNWRVKLLPCRWLDEAGVGSVAGALSCFDYAGSMKDRGVNIVATNNSWGGERYSQSLFDAVQEHWRKGILCIAAAGNDDYENDIFPRYPANYFLPNVISIAATSSSGYYAMFSNLGTHIVHLGAPGEQVLSTMRGSGYELADGTSMAAAHVAGLAALLKAADASLDWKAIKNLIMSGGDTTSYVGRTISDRRLSAHGSMTCSDSTVYRRLRPISASYNEAIETGYAGVPLDLAALHINCDQPNGEIPVTVYETGEEVTLADDGMVPDQEAADGVYSAHWTPPAGGRFRLIYPAVNGIDDVDVKVLDNYQFTTTPFNYRNISGTNLNLAPGATAQIPDPFTVRFGGLYFGDIYVGDNGVISLSSPFNDTLNQSLPTPRVSTLIAPFWDDLHPEPGTEQNVFWEIAAGASHRELIIEWRNLRHYECRQESSSTVKFQVVLFEGTSEVLFNYADTIFGGGCGFADRGGSATIGIQVGPNVGTEFSFESPDLSDESAILWRIPAAVHLSPLSLTFFDQRVDTTSGPMSVRLNNVGTVPVNVASAETTGDFNFYMTRCDRTLYENDSCFVHVTFTPTATGLRTGTLTVTHDASGSPHVIPLAGKGYDGVGPVLELSATRLDFGEQRRRTTSAEQTVTLANTGDAGLGIRAIALYSENFSQTNTCGVLPRQMEAGESCTISVFFAPVGMGEVTGEVEIDIASTGVVFIFLTGTGVASQVRASPSELDFGNQVAGIASAPQALTLTNTGTATLTVAAIEMEGWSVFTQTNNCNTTLQVGEACTVSVTFTPPEETSYGGFLVVSSDAVNSPTSIRLRGNGVSAFTLAADANEVKASAGDTATFTIAAASDWGFTGNINLSCIGTTAAHCEFRPASITPGQSSTLTIRNLARLQGSFKLDRVPFSVEGTSGIHYARLDVTVQITDFSISISPWLQTIKAGESTEFTVTVTPHNGFDETVSLSCEENIAGGSCSVSPASLAISGVYAATAQVSVTTSGSSWVPPPMPVFFARRHLAIAAALLGLLALALLPFALSSSCRAWQHLAVAFTLTAIAIACGGGSSGSAPPPPRGGATYTLTVTAGAGNLTHKATAQIELN